LKKIAIKATCFFCEEGIYVGEDKRMEALEFPYANIFFHKKCHSKIKDMLEYLSSDIPKLLKYIGSKTDAK